MRALTLACAWALFSCSGTTGGETINFQVAAAGPEGIGAGTPLTFINDQGWSITLNRATLHVGGVYLNESRPVSGAQSTDCYLPGTYVAQQTTGLDVDLLNPDLQPFPTLAHGTTMPALVGQVWLTGGHIDAPNDKTTIFAAAGVARKNGDERKFSAAMHIGSNRRDTSGDLPGAKPICKQRIVTPIDADMVVQPKGGLVLRIDPRHFFGGVDFSELVGEQFADDSSDTPSATLYENLRAAQTGGPYTLTWSEDL